MGARSMDVFEGGVVIIAHVDFQRVLRGVFRGFQGFWIFNGFALNDDVDIGFDATGSVEFDNEGSFAFCEISLNISRDCRLT